MNRRSGEKANERHSLSPHLAQTDNHAARLYNFLSTEELMSQASSHRIWSEEVSLNPDGRNQMSDIPFFAQRTDSNSTAPLRGACVVQLEGPDDDALPDGTSFCDDAPSRLIDAVGDEAVMRYAIHSPAEDEIVRRSVSGRTGQSVDPVTGISQMYLPVSDLWRMEDCDPFRSVSTNVMEPVLENMVFFHDARTDTRSILSAMDTPRKNYDAESDALLKKGAVRLMNDKKHGARSTIKFEAQSVISLESDAAESRKRGGVLSSTSGNVGPSPDLLSPESGTFDPELFYAYTQFSRRQQSIVGGVKRQVGGFFANLLGWENPEDVEFAKYLAEYRNHVAVPTTAAMGNKCAEEHSTQEEDVDVLKCGAVATDEGDFPLLEDLPLKELPKEKDDGMITLEGAVVSSEKELKQKPLTCGAVIVAGDIMSDTDVPSDTDIDFGEIEIDSSNGYRSRTPSKKPGLQRQPGEGLAISSSLGDHEVVHAPKDYSVVDAVGYYPGSDMINNMQLKLLDNMKMKLFGGSQNYEQTVDKWSRTAEDVGGLAITIVVIAGMAISMISALAHVCHGTTPLEEVVWTKNSESNGELQRRAIVKTLSRSETKHYKKDRNYHLSNVHLRRDAKHWHPSDNFAPLSDPLDDPDILEASEVVRNMCFDFFSFALPTTALLLGALRYLSWKLFVLAGLLLGFRFPRLIRDLASSAQDLCEMVLAFAGFAWTALPPCPSRIKVTLCKQTVTMRWFGSWDHCFDGSALANEMDWA